MGSQDASPLRETSKDPFSGDCSCQQDGLTVIITACLTFATGVTVALIMQIYFGDPQLFQRGAVVTDAARCTALGIEVLSKQGSSVDAAIASVLCMGVVNPHISGIGGLPWSQLLGLVAAVAQDGFNVTHDLAKAVSELKDLNYSDKFREMCIRDRCQNNVLASHISFTVFIVSVKGEVQNYGGVLVEEDFSNYSVTVENPVHTTYRGHLVLSPPPPHAGPALITALNILEGFNITNLASRGSILHWMAELINDSQPFSSDLHLPHFSVDSEPVAGQVLVMGPDDIIVAVVSSLNRPFGSGIMTPSGVLLNSQMLDFSWQNKTMNHSIPRPQNLIQPRKRPLSYLLPTIVRPSEGMCGTYLSLGASSGDKALSGIVQVLVNVLVFNKNLSESLSLGRLHPQLQSNILQVDSEFPEEDIECLVARGHEVDKVKVLSLVHGARRTNSFIIGLKDPRSVDAAGATIL
ncbi:UNVERIFIED_CONTAM: hypothetical protein H355_008478 [Colinus virginianus]|nr:hypothetical protein H355_008478 [Colinus virginianus]